jgi:hypothetical protein
MNIKELANELCEVADEIALLSFQPGTPEYTFQFMSIFAAFTYRSARPPENIYWIDVKDKLPLYMECIIFMTVDEDIIYGIYNGYDINNDKYSYSSFDRENSYSDEVTHWIPLPKIKVDV